MSHGDCVTVAPAGFTVTARSRGRAGGRVRGRGPPAGRRAVPPRGRAHRARAAGARAVPARRSPASGRPGPRPTSSTSRWRRSGPQVGDGQVDLRAVRRGRLRGRRGAGAPGRRRSADLCVRRPRPAAGRRGRAGREGLRRRDRHPAEGGRRGRPVPRRAGRGHRPGAEAEDHRPGVHPGLRGGRRDWRSTPSGTSSSWSRARSTRTWSSRAAAPAPRTSSRHHNVGGLPDDLRVRAGRAAADCCSRTRSGRSARSWACPRRSCGATRSPGRGWRSGSSARSPRDRLELLRAADQIARDELHRGRAGPRRVAVPGGAAGRCPQRRRAGRRPDVRSSGRAAPGVQ